MWVLGLVSLLMDLSSEMIHALLPVYLVTVMGASALTVGIIEGIAEATASITRLFSGAASDWIGRRKTLTAAGYGLAAFTKPVFPLAPTVAWIVGARFVDRIGKGIRGAPRDALLADLSPPAVRGASFGLRQSLDTVGAFLGPLAAIVLMRATDDGFRTVFWIAVVPAFAAFALVTFAVHEPPREPGASPQGQPLRREELARLGAQYWWVVGVAAVFTMARFSEAFLVLRAQSLGLALSLVPSVLVAMNVSYTLTAYPAGAVSDRGERARMLVPGLVVLVIADLLLAFTGGIAGLFAGVLLWGLHMGLTQGILSALVADSAPTSLRGTAFGIFNLVTGLGLLAASTVAGALWDAIGPEGTFLAGAGFAVATLLALVPLRRHLGAPTPTADA